MKRRAQSIYIACMALLLAPTAGAKPIEAGDTLPPIMLRDLDGKMVRFATMFDGDTDDPQMVVIDFWATWCAPCVAELPDIAAFQRKYGKQGVQTYLINQKEQPDRVRRFVQKHKLDLPVLLDKSGITSRRLGVLELPVLLVLDSRGDVRIRHAGGIEDVKGFLESAWKEVAKPTP